MRIKATKTGIKKYPELDVSSQAKMKRKRGTTERDHTLHWKKNITVKQIETKLRQKYYFSDNDTVGSLRHEFH